MTGMADDRVEHTVAVDGDDLIITVTSVGPDGVDTLHTRWSREDAASLRDALTRWLDGDLP